MNNVDYTVLIKMGAAMDATLERLMGDEELFMEFLCRLPDNQDIVNLKKAVKIKDSENAKNAVHSLKGLAMNLGLKPLESVCSKMNQDFVDKRYEEAFDRYKDVEEEFNRWSNVITEYYKH